LNLSEKLKTFIAKKETNIEDPTPVSTKYPPADKILGANTVDTSYGEHLMLEKIYPLCYEHGKEELSQVFNISGEILSLMGKDRAFKDFDFAKTLFIDTETTGLAGGTGTLAFLIGVGYFKDNKFKVVQYFMRDYDEERAVLSSLGECVKVFDNIASFNGKSYDIPLLSTRYMLNRLDNPFEELLHLDLLSSARRLYRQRLDSVSLSSLEQNLFFMKRHGDIPGYEIPSVYFRFLRDRNPFPLKPIFYHNRIDILSMVSLSIYMAKSFKDPFCSKICKEQDFFCLGRVFEDMGKIPESISCYEKAMTVSGVREKAHVKLSLLYKRLGRWHDAKQLWIAMVKANIQSLFALVELAKFYEHRVKDYDSAIVATQRALEIAYKKKGLLGDLSKDEIDKLKKRLDRVKGKKLRNITLKEEFFDEKCNENSGGVYGTFS